MVFIYLQELLKDISRFTSQPKAKFYDDLFINLDLSCIPACNSRIGRTSYSNHAMICAFIVMKYEGFSQISDLHDYLSNNLIIAHYAALTLLENCLPERYNSRFKQAGCERVFVRNGNSVKNLNTIAHISLLSILITVVVTKKNISYRCAKSMKRIA